MRIARVLFITILALSLFSCKKNMTSDLFKPVAENKPGHIVNGQTYYTQFVIRYEKGVHQTTNYRRGASLPVNTPVKLLNISGKTIDVEINDTAQKLEIKNVNKHTGDDVYQAFDKLFAKTRVDLSKFTSLERANIDKGEVAKGMSKDAVIVAIGYPPITETASLDVDRWVYWSGRFNRFVVHFKNGKVSQVEN